MPPEPGRPTRTELVAQVADLANKLAILVDGQNDHEDRLVRLEQDIAALRAAHRDGASRRAPGVMTPSPQRLAALQAQREASGVP